MRDIIIAATIEEIKVRGLRFTMQDLAARLKVSKRSLYENFTSKEELIGALLEAILADMERQEQVICDGSDATSAKLQKLLTVHPYDAEMFNKNIYEDLKRIFPRQWQLIEEARLRRQQRLERLLADGVACGELRPVHIGLVGQLIKDAFASFTSYSFLDKNGLTYKGAMAELLDILLQGIARKG
ncbi:MAG: helix-turn-helix domain-containing protein [Phascolarctobacterium sp.]|uniref:TetR/AcrR family transcriptional regulator n=1 Tax=Phascolarctobacterium sp. TaxID=2049039 RepID=UPI0026DC48E7|nr:TetR/AcrR family transcriptional regulator [Phascolarctobacterium sp.]MDO4922376.1 helix-turn-helix domain-containing protein [Phascolarctobacterium sp.]